MHSGAVKEKENSRLWGVMKKRRQQQQHFTKGTLKMEVKFMTSQLVTQNRRSGSEREQCV
jgi:hypothetical protein